MTSKVIIDDLIDSGYVGKFISVFDLLCRAGMGEMQGEARLKIEHLSFQSIETSNWNGVLEEIGFPLKPKRKTILSYFSKPKKVKKTRSSKKYKLPKIYDKRLNPMNPIYLYVRVIGIKNPDQNDPFSFEIVMDY